MNKEIITFAEGEVIFRKDEMQPYFYEIISGSVYIYSDYGMPSERRLTEMKPGQTFGEMGLLSHQKRSATAVAAADTEVIQITDEDLEIYIKEDPNRLLRMMNQLSERTRELTHDYNDALHTVDGIRRNKKDKGLLARISRFAGIGRA